MFSFKILDSLQHVSRDKFLKLIRDTYCEDEDEEFCFKNRLNLTFILGHTQDGKNVGGACLLKRDIHHLPEDLEDLLTPFTENTAWECSSIQLDPFLYHIGLGVSSTETLLRTFYYDLYEAFVQFGLSKGINFMVVRLLPETYRPTKILGLWPYVVELEPKFSSDGLFYGILPLMGSPYDKYRTDWKKMLAEEAASS